MTAGILDCVLNTMLTFTELVPFEKEGRNIPSIKKPVNLFNTKKLELLPE